MKEIYEVLIRSTLDARSIEYFQDLNQYRFMYEACYGFAYVRVIMEPLNEGVRIGFHHPVVAAEEKREVVADFLKRLNAIVPHGGFYLTDEGEIIYQIDLRVDIDKPVSHKAIYMRFVLAKITVIFSLCARAVMEVLYNRDVVLEQLLEKLKSDMPAQNSRWKEIATQEDSSGFALSTGEADDGTEMP